MSRPRRVRTPRSSEGTATTAPEALPPEIRRAVSVRLGALEAREDVRILLAVESGSRAWGFPSADSDYDVRFLYVRRPDWYASVDLEERRDVIEETPEPVLDVSGWDLRKALRLLRKSNPPLLEWLDSPLIYREDRAAATRLRALRSRYYSPRACWHHYLHMAQGNFREYLQGPEVRVKKYFYVLRPLLGVIWIERGLGAVPMRFEALVEALLPRGALRDSIADLVARKRAGAELDRGPRIEPISQFLEVELARLEAADDRTEVPEAPIEPLNACFGATLADVWKRRGSITGATPAARRAGGRTRPSRRR